MRGSEAGVVLPAFSVATCGAGSPHATPRTTPSTNTRSAILANSPPRERLSRGLPPCACIPAAGGSMLLACTSLAFAQILDQAEGDDWFGSALATGDFDGDG